MSPDRYAAALLEAIPDGTYGQADHSPWTPEEQAQHRADMCDAFRIPNNYDHKPNPRRRNRSRP